MDAAFGRSLGEILTVAAGAMPGGPPASLVLAGEDGPRTVASSVPGAAVLDALQFGVGVGPCLEALASGEAVWSDDLAGETRWGGLSAELAAQGVRSVHARPLTFDGRVHGTLNLYAERAGGFPAETLTVSAVTAGQAAVLYDAVRRAARLDEVIAQLREALDKRAVIDQALGIIMARRQCTASAAFDLLRRGSQQRNVKVHQVAADLVEAVTGQPPQPSRFHDPPAACNASRTVPR
ncbi:GAF and ANTAR domain-containing protein [Nonomuraea sp. MCN248]|uniref:GAF and ANTAR domain-containing protein n=1 Tax=Nonomuraea corallina TaxID=2989783 RepID=A0ABT4S9J6_9ACTN|nr:GAF and ANTAR domain-containing protein [Nonomuraea corallina]MDA0633859.1 GAF and ANTAR domain-containing protein [Nonomuraea corallina]